MKTLGYFLATCILLAACGKQESDDLLRLSPQTDYIKTGTTCGFCAGVCMDTLVITPDKLYYKTVSYETEDPKSEFVEQSFSRQGWENLLGLVDLHEFQGLEYESCARCFDGCDLWLEISTADARNTISFPRNEHPVEVDSLISALNTIREQLR